MSTANSDVPDIPAIERLLKVGYCNPVWRRHVVALLSEVERLRDGEQTSGRGSISAEPNP